MVLEMRCVDICLKASNTWVFLLVAATALGFEASTVGTASKVAEAEAPCFTTLQAFLHMTRGSPFSITCSLIVHLCRAGTVAELEMEKDILME